jgi:hypothetical protein
MRCSHLPLLCFLLTAQSPPGQAQPNARLSGAWAIDPTRSDDVNASINTAITRLNIVLRQIARPRLRSANIPYPQLIFTFDDSVRVDMPGYRSVASPTSGAPVRWHRRTGHECPEVHGACVEVTTTWQEGTLVQTFHSHDGDRRNVFSVSPDGATLTMAVTLTSPRLPAPVAYRLLYSRVP